MSIYDPIVVLREANWQGDCYEFQPHGYGCQDHRPEAVSKLETSEGTIYFCRECKAHWLKEWQRLPDAGTDSG
jgi:hypothetical protein